MEKFDGEESHHKLLLMVMQREQSANLLPFTSSCCVSMCQTRIAQSPPPVMMTSPCTCMLHMLFPANKHVKCQMWMKSLVNSGAY